MGKKFAFVPDTMTIGGLAHDTIGMGTEDYVVVHLVYSKQRKDFLNLFGKDSKNSEMGEIKETKKSGVSHPVLSWSPIQIVR